MGLASPLLGPWFSSPITLGEPNTFDLSVVISGSTTWLPPAGGTLTLILLPGPSDEAGTGPHRLLVDLRNVAGEPLFSVASAAGSMLLLFTLLPEVEVRLAQLYAAVPGGRLGDVAGGPRRPIPRTFALTLAAPTNLDGFRELLGLGTLSNLSTIGLDNSTGQLRNATRPMAWLRRPGRGEPLAGIAGEGRMYVFDREGLPIDPGAVASALHAVGTAYPTVLHAGAVTENSICACEPRRNVHLVGPAGGPVAPALLNSVTVNAASGEAPLRPFDDELLVSRDEAAASERPHVRVGLLPAGPYQSEVRLGRDDVLARDYIRIGLLDVELLLTGASRVVEASVAHSRQSRALTRIELTRLAEADAAVLLPNHEALLHKLSAMLERDDPVRIVAGAIESRCGPLRSPLVSSELPPPELPDEVVSLEVLSVRGGAGPDEAGSVDWAPAMQAVVRVTLGPESVGAWVRVLPLDFDLKSGARVRMAGGAGRAMSEDGNALAYTLVTLPPGRAVPSDENDLLAFDVEIATARGQRLFGSLLHPRIPRPLASPGSVIVDQTGGFPPEAAAIIICESGEQLRSSAGVWSLPSGLTPIVKLASGDLALLDTDQAPVTLYAESLGARLRAGDSLVTTARVWRDSPAGTAPEQLASTGATVTHTVRRGLELPSEAGAPLPTQERAEVVISQVGVESAEALIGALPLVDRYHELVPSMPGRAGEPAGSEAHATAVHLTGQAAVQAVEFTRSRRFSSSAELLRDVIEYPSPVLPAPSGAGPIVALLRTIAASVEGEPALHAAALGGLAALLESEEPEAALDELVTTLRLEFQRLGLGELPDLSALPFASTALQVLRCAAQRILAANVGFQEAAQAIIASIKAAERFIYIETSALDVARGTVDGDNEINLLDALKTRLKENPRLYVVCCLPFTIEHPAPSMRRIRAMWRQEALDRLREASSPAVEPLADPVAERLIIFSQLGAAGRSLHIASTTVIVDDVVAMTGSFALTRRGLTFDSSLGVALFDEQLAHGRPREVLSFRQQLLADRLGIPVNTVPYDGVAAARMVRAILQGKLNLHISAPKPYSEELPTTDSAVPFHALDPDGRLRDTVDYRSYLAGLLLPPPDQAALA